MNKKQDNINQIINGLDNEGFSKLEIAGILGGLRGETKDFDPTTRQTYYKTDKKTGKKVKKQGKGFGIAQWELGYDKKGKPRRGELLKAFAKKNNSNHKDLDTQIKFLIHEIRGSERGNWDKIKKGKSAGEIAQLFTRHFERPATSLWKKGKKNEGNLDRTTTPITEEEKKRGKYADSFMKDVNSHKFKNNLNKQAKPYLGDDVPVNEDKKQLMKETLKQMKMGNMSEPYHESYNEETNKGGAEALPYKGGAETLPWKEKPYMGGAEELPSVRREELSSSLKPFINTDTQQEVTPIQREQSMKTENPKKFRDVIQERIDADKLRMNREQALNQLKHGGIVYADDGDSMSVLGTETKKTSKNIFGGAQQGGGGQLTTLGPSAPSTQTSGVAQNATATGAPAPSEKKGSGSFTNINKYIDANQPATKKMSENVIGKVSDEATGLTSDLQQKTQAKLDEATRIRQDLGTPTQETTQVEPGQPQSFQDKAIEDAMTGRTAFDTETEEGKANLERFSRLREGTTQTPEAVDLSNESLRLDALNKLGKGIGTSEGRADLLSQNLDRSGYTRGQSNLDSYLFGRDPSVRGENITAIQDKVKAVRDRMSTSKEALAPISEDIKQRVAEASKSIIDKIQGMRTGIVEGAEQSAEAYNKAKAEYGAFLDGSSETISQEAADLLGLKAGQETFGMNSQTLGPESQAGGMIDQAGFNKLNALSQLSGQDVTATSEKQVENYISPEEQMIANSENISEPAKAEFTKYSNEKKNVIQNEQNYINSLAPAISSTNRWDAIRVAKQNHWDGSGGWNRAHNHLVQLTNQARAKQAQRQTEINNKAIELNRRTLKIG